jgi:predicted DNA-binding transcriptional regulator YafY
MSGRNAQVARIFAILDLLDGSPHGLSVSDIWTKVQTRGHEVGLRTVYRDLEALNRAGFPLFPEGDGEASRWKMERHSRVAEYLVLSARELFALYLAREALLPLEATEFYQDLTEAFGKIEAKLGSNSQKYVETLRAEVRYEPSPRWGFGLDAELVDTVRAAAAEGQVLEVYYRSVNGGGVERKRRLGAQFINIARAGIYLVAEDLEVGQVKIFSLARMRDAVMLDEAYDGTAVNPEQFFATSLGVFRGGEAERVELAFSGPVAEHVRERQWHPSQQASVTQDGRVHLSLDVAVTPELQQWVLGFGGDVEVLGPQSLREQIAEMAGRVVALYEPRRRPVASRGGSGRRARKRA